MLNSLFSELSEGPFSKWKDIVNEVANGTANSEILGYLLLAGVLATAPVVLAWAAYRLATYHAPYVMPREEMSTTQEAAYELREAGKDFVSGREDLRHLVRQGALSAFSYPFVVTWTRLCIFCGAWVEAGRVLVARSRQRRGAG